MFLKSKKMFVIILIMAGIVLSFLNFVPKLYAPAIFGTTVELDGGQIEWFEMVFGEQWLEDRHIDDNFYCMGIECDCVQVT